MRPALRGPTRGRRHARARADRKAAGYRSVLRTPVVARTLAGTLVGRLPAAMAPITVLIVLAHHGIARAGALSAGHSLAAALSQPALARAADRHGQRRVLAATTAAATAVYAALAATVCAPLPAIGTLAVLSGATAPPLQSSLRGRWGELVAADAQSAAQALDAVTTEMLYILAPLLAAGLCLVSPAAAYAAAAATGAAGTALVITGPLPRSRWRTARVRADLLGPLRAGGLRLLLVVHLAVGVCLGAVPVAALHTALLTHHPGVTGQVTAALFGGSAFGGLLYGARRPPGSTRRHLTAAAAGFAASLTALPATAAHPLAATAVAATAGLWFAPLLTAGQLQAQQLAAPHARTESAGWLIGALGAGEAAGTAISASTRIPAAAWPPVAALAAFALLLCARDRLNLAPAGEQVPGPALPTPHRDEESDAPVPSHRTPTLPLPTGAVAR